MLIELCKECSKPENYIDHEEHPHNGSVIGHYFQHSGKYISFQEYTRRKSIETLRGNLLSLSFRLKDTQRDIKQTKAALKKLTGRPQCAKKSKTA